MTEQKTRTFMFISSYQYVYCTHPCELTADTNSEFIWSKYYLFFKSAGAEKIGICFIFQEFSDILFVVKYTTNLTLNLVNAKHQSVP